MDSRRILNEKRQLPFQVQDSESQTLLHSCNMAITKEAQKGNLYSS